MKGIDDVTSHTQGHGNAPMHRGPPMRKGPPMHEGPLTPRGRRYARGRRHARGHQHTRGQRRARVQHHSDARPITLCHNLDEGRDRERGHIVQKSVGECNDDELLSARVRASRMSDITSMWCCVPNDGEAMVMELHIHEGPVTWCRITDTSVASHTRGKVWRRDGNAASHDGCRVEAVGEGSDNSDRMVNQKGKRLGQGEVRGRTIRRASRII